MNKSSHRKHLFLRYLLIPVYFVIPLFLRFILYFLVGLLINFLTGLSFEAIVILILLGIVSIGLGFWIIALLYSGVSFVGYKIMQFSPNKVVFWVVFVLSALQVFHTLTGYISATNTEELLLPFWVDILLSLFVFTCYGMGGFTRSTEDKSLSSGQIQKQ